MIVRGAARLQLNAVLVLVVTATAVLGLPTGAPELACATITPVGHNATANMATGPAPFNVDTSGFMNGTYVPGQTYTIQLSSVSSSFGFRGFLIQGRIMADGTTPAGTFVFNGGTRKAKATCSDNSAATHTNNTGLALILLTWRAPPAGTGTIAFRYAFVNTYRPTDTPATNVYWANLITPIIREGVGGTGGTTGIMAASSVMMLLFTNIIILLF